MRLQALLSPNIERGLKWLMYIFRLYCELDIISMDYSEVHNDIEGGGGDADNYT